MSHLIFFPKQTKTLQCLKIITQMQVLKFIVKKKVPNQELLDSNSDTKDTDAKSETNKKYMARKPTLIPSKPDSGVILKVSK